MIPLQKILDSPERTIEDVVKIKSILPADYVYVNVRREDIARYSKSLRDKGFNVGLILDLNRIELKGAYVLEIR